MVDEWGRGRYRDFFIMYFRLQKPKGVGTEIRVVVDEWGRGRYRGKGVGR